MVEEEFRRDDEEEEDIGVTTTMDDQSADDEAEQLKKEQQFNKEDRVQAFKDLAYINKFARNCPQTSRMRFLTVQKFKFSGPDPPAEPAKLETEEVQEDVKSPPAKGKKEEAPVEVELTEEEKLELKMFDDFVEEYCACME